MDKIKKIELLFSGLQATATIIAAVALIQSCAGLSLAREQMAEDHRRSRREFALSLWDVWAETFDRSPTIRDSMYRIRNDMNIRWEEVLKAPKGSSDHTLRNDCIAMMNTFEKVATARKHKIADPDLVDEAFKDIIYDYYEYLKGFRDAWGKDRPGKGWPAVDELVAAWSPKPVTAQSATGQ
jgi:hypothetical protein